MFCKENEEGSQEKRERLWLTIIKYVESAPRQQWHQYVLLKKWKKSEVTQSCPTLCDPMDTRLLHPWDFLGKSTGVGCRFLLQGTSWPGDQTQVSHIVDRRFPSEPPLDLKWVILHNHNSKRCLSVFTINSQTKNKRKSQLQVTMGTWLTI